MNAQLKPAPLPATVEELEALKVIKVSSLNDDVNRIHKALWETEEYRKFHEAVFDEDAVEGSCTADNLEAAAMIRDYAEKSGYPELRYIIKKNKTVLVKSMNVVLRRYHMSRKERAMTVAGEVVPNNGNTAE